MACKLHTSLRPRALAAGGPPKPTPASHRGSPRSATPLGRAPAPTAAAAARKGGGGSTWQHRRPRQPLAPPPRAAASEADYESDVDGQTLEQRLQMVHNMVATSELLVPYDRSAVNLGLIMWGAVRNVPHKHRRELLSRLDSGDIKRLWKVAGQRYTAPMSQQAATLGPDYSIWRDMPSEEAAGQLAVYHGRAALPTHVLGVSSFGKAFFLQPRTGELYGRVLLGKGPLGDLLYPLYFKARVGTAVVPITQEPCDLVLQYLPPEQLGLTPDDLPRSRWPAPKAPLPPFHDGFTDYLRAVAPGVYVGLGYRTASTEASDPLYFLMTLDKFEDLS